MGEEPSPPTPHVLVVANSATTLTALAEHLTALGQTVAVAHHTAEVLAPGANSQWDAVVIDLTPTEQALDLVRRLTEQQPELATIVLSSDRRPSSIRAVFQAGAYLWLPTPCPDELVAATVLRANERRLLRRASAGLYRDGVSSAVAHAINNQLAGIMGLTQLHIADETLSPDMREDLEIVLQSARAIGDHLKPLRND